MKLMLGCLGVVAAVLFAIAFIAVPLFERQALLGQRLAVSAMTAVVFTVILASAVMLLAWRDRSRFRWTKQKVTEQLIQRSDVNDIDFCESFPQHDPRLLLEIRKAIATYFTVPHAKIHPADDLDNEFAWHDLSPSILLFVTYRVWAAFKVTLPANRVVGFPTSVRIDGFADEIQESMRKFRELEADKRE